MNFEQIGSQIKTIRKTQGLTQEELSQLSGINCVTIGIVEAGSSNYSLKTLDKIVKSLGCTFRVVIEKV